MKMYIIKWQKDAMLLGVLQVQCFLKALIAGCDDWI